MRDAKIYMYTLKTGLFIIRSDCISIIIGVIIGVFTPDYSASNDALKFVPEKHSRSSGRDTRGATATI